MREAARAWSRAAELAAFRAEYLVGLSTAQLGLAAGGDASARTAALSTARRAAEVDRFVPNVQRALAIAAAANGLSQEALAAAELYQRLEPGPDPIVAEAAGAALLAVKRFDEAERWLRLGLTTDPPSGYRLRFLLARVLAAQGRTAEALAEIDLGLKVDPENKDALRLKAELSP
jgi:tetratricopeptide (TPR) repeat protein